MDPYLCSILLNAVFLSLFLCLFLSFQQTSKMGCNWNLDNLAAYQTPRVAKIKDWRLGILWYGGCFFIVMYIVVWAILLNKEYLNQQPPQGAVRTTALSPRDVNTSYVNPTPEEIDYCYVDGRNTVPGTNFSTFPCLYFDQDLTVFPIGEDSAISLTTRLTNGTKELGNCTAYDSNCPWLVTEEEDNYIANIEQFTIMVDHSFSAPDVKISMVPSTKMSGTLQDQNKEVIKQFPKHTADIVTLEEFLIAGGISSLDTQSLTTPDRSIRDDGIVLLVFIEYSNTFTFSTSRMRYTMTVQPQPTKFKVEEPIFTKNQANILVWNRHGVKLIFIQTGLLGHFSFSVLLLTFISGVGLIAICSVVVDLLAVYLIPESDIYYKYKYLETPERKAIQEKSYVQIEGDLSGLDRP